MVDGSLITDELRKMIGVSLEPITFKVEEGAIQRYAQAIGDPNPLYNDVDFAAKSKYRRLICPPGFTGWPVKGEISVFKLGEYLIEAGAPQRSLDMGADFEFFEPVGAGDVLDATIKIASITERETRLGKTLFVTVEITFVNQKGKEALKSRYTFIHF